MSDVAPTTAPAAPATAPVVEKIVPMPESPAQVVAELATPPVEAPPAEPVYEIKLPEGVKADPAFTAELIETAKKSGLTPAQAQSAADFYVGQQTKAIKAWQESVSSRDVKNLERLKTEWGVDFEANRVLAEKAMVRFGSPEAAKYLQQRGLGSDPVLLGMLARAGKAIAEDRTVRSSAATSAEAAGVTDAQEAIYQRYPSMRPKIEAQE